MGYSGARGTLIYEKNLMSKISCQTPNAKTLSWKKANKWPWCLQNKGKLIIKQQIRILHWRISGSESDPDSGPNVIVPQTELL